MKLKFKNQDFQTDAVNTVVDLFTGQEKTRSTFSVVEEKQVSLMNDLGVGNALFIDSQAISDNMHAVQKRNRLPMTPNADDMQFCIEMETGTGKTYVYTKTIFELNRRYGFKVSLGTVLIDNKLITCYTVGISSMAGDLYAQTAEDRRGVSARYCSGNRKADPF